MSRRDPSLPSVSARSLWPIAALAALAGFAVVAFALSLSQGPSGLPVAEPLPSSEPIAADEDDAAADDAGHDTALNPGDLATTSDVFLSRDPFEPVVPEDEPAPADAADPVDSDDPDDTDDPGDPIELDDPDDPDAQPLPPHPKEGPTEAGATTLLGIATVDDTQVAVVQIGTTIYEVGVDQEFDDGFMIVKIFDDAVWLSKGDVVTTLEVGQTVLK